MLICTDWVADYVNLDGISMEELAEKITMATAETEGVTKIERATKDIVIAEITAVEKQEKGSLVTVNSGSGEYTTYCGAPNARVGLKAIFAPVGAKLGDGAEVKAAEVQGVMSEGVLCSAKDLGWSQWHDIIIECPSHVPVGSALGDHVPEVDYVIEVDNKSLTHRPDLWGQFGFSREIAAILGRELVPLGQFDLLKKEYQSLPEITIDTESSEDCPCYTAVRFKTAVSEPAPLRLQARLHAVGQRTFSLVVDMTNYVTFGLGQPTHAFDGEKIDKIRVARMGAEREFLPLDDQPRKMRPDDLMIWNGEKPVAIAGVMGGAETEINTASSEVLLESANFLGSKVRNTALYCNLRTDASQRFEKSQPAANCQVATAMILDLIEQNGYPVEILSKFCIEGDLDDQYRMIELPCSFIPERAGIAIPNERICGILESLEFTTEIDGETLRVGIPPFRSRRDIAVPVDIVEEVLRIYGYDNIPPQAPRRGLEPVPLNEDVEVEHALARSLALFGYTEAHCYSWFDDNWTDKLGYKPQNVLTLANPSAVNTAIMRDSLVPNLLKMVESNIMVAENIRYFECGRVYRPAVGVSEKEAAGADCLEHLQLAGVTYQHHCKDVFPLYLETKGDIERLARKLGQTFDFVKSDEDRDAVLEERLGVAKQTGPAEQPWVVGGMHVDILLGEERVGKIGILPEGLRKKIFPNGRAVWFTLLPEFLSMVESEKYRPIPEYPGSTHDFSIVWPMEKGYRELDAKLAEFSHSLVAKREFVTSFFGKALPEGQASYTFRFQLQSLARTLAAEDIEDFRENFEQFLAQEKLELRS